MVLKFQTAATAFDPEFMAANIFKCRSFEIQYTAQKLLLFIVYSCTNQLFSRGGGITKGDKLHYNFPACPLSSGSEIAET